MKKYFFVWLCTFILTVNSFAQSDSPKREFRAAWIATVANIDWPRSTDAEKQKKELISLLDNLKEANINAVLLQVRPECDALYDSPYEPWSKWLTGTQGKAPSPYYDPLKFACEEAHKRGMELHAWFNPYRAETSIGSYNTASSHVTKAHPEWIFERRNKKILDPGLPKVREFVTNVVLDVVNRYDIDGVHFDDYFYPYGGMGNEDAETFKNYNRGITNLANWRRDNVNLLVKMVYDSIQVAKPHVKFGISPFGIWQSGYPSGIIGMNAYSEIYCDALAWLSAKTVDYLTPQTYWRIGGSQDFIKLTNWWAGKVKAAGLHLYPGQAAYRMYDSNGWAVSEITNQIEHVRSNPDILGSVFFSAKSIPDNSKDLKGVLANGQYKYKALPPSMNWKDQVNPNQPQNVKFGAIPSLSQAGLYWDSPVVASDGDNAFMYVIYKFDKANISSEDLADSRNIVEVTSNKYFVEKTSGDIAIPTYVVTALDRNFNESIMSNTVSVNAPVIPTLLLPKNNASNQPDTVCLSWNAIPNASCYSVKVASDNSFENIVFSNENVIGNECRVTGLFGQKDYYWKVAASNTAGTSEFSPTWKYITGFPVAPLMVYPEDRDTASLAPTFVWNKMENATCYNLQVAYGTSIYNGTKVIDITDIKDTCFTITSKLQDGRVYSWWVLSQNNCGTSKGVSFNRLLTSSAVSVSDESTPLNYTLSQNYPNPFNPSTTISYSLPERGLVALKIYNLLGEEVRSIFNHEIEAGNYTFTFDASNLPSGIYIYQLRTNSGIISKKMTLIK